MTCGERERGEELRAVLGETAAAGLHVTELAFDHPGRMLGLRPNHGDDPVDPPVEGMQLSTLGGLAHDTPEPSRARERGLRRRADIELPSRRSDSDGKLRSDVCWSASMRRSEHVETQEPRRGVHGVCGARSREGRTHRVGTGRGIWGPPSTPGQCLPESWHGSSASSLPACEKESSMLAPLPEPRSGSILR